MIEALVADGWTVTDDPLTFTVEDRTLFIDLGAERSTAGRDERIAVEVQTFPSRSVVHDLERAVGQYVLYRSVLSRERPDRPVFLAVPRRVYDGILSEPLGRIMVVDLSARLIVFDPDRREVVRWISWPATGRSSGGCWASTRSGSRRPRRCRARSSTTRASTTSS